MKSSMKMPFRFRKQPFTGPRPYIASSVTRILLLFLLFSCHPGGQISGQDSDGIPSQGFSRIVSLAPSLTETLFAVGAGDRVVGVTRFCAWPEEALTRQQVGGFLDTNYESIVALRPDIVLALPSHREHRERLQSLGLRFEIIEQTTVADILASIPRIGLLTGQTVQARQVAEELTQRLETIRTHTRDKSHPRTLLSSGRNPADNTLSEVYVVGKKSFLNDLLEIAGGENAYPNDHVEYPMLSMEGIIQLNPECVIEFVNEEDTRRYPDELYLDAWNRLHVLKAVQNGRVYLIRGAHHTIPGPSIWVTAQEIARRLHPDLSEFYVQP